MILHLQSAEMLGPTFAQRDAQLVLRSGVGQFELQTCKD